MSFHIKIQEVTFETVTKGRNSYQIANVVYSYNDQNKTQKIFSFSNPDVFKSLQMAKPGEAYSVDTVKTIGRDNREYMNWSRLTKIVEEDSNSPFVFPPSPVSRPVGNQYETREERQFRQLMIARQSSLERAIEYFTEFRTGDEYVTVSDICTVAQKFVDFVYGSDEYTTMEKVDTER